MGSNLAKIPLTGFLYAAVFTFVAVLFPYSSGFYSAISSFTMPWYGTLILVAYGVWVSAVVAMGWFHCRAKGFSLLGILMAAVLGLQWISFFLLQMMQGEATGTMTVLDTLYVILSGAVTTAVLFILAKLLFRNEHDKAGILDRASMPKYRVKTLPLVIRLIVLPVIFMVLYFLVWYFLLWRSADVRAFYGSGGTEGFFAEIINMLLTNAREVLFQLLRGLVYALFSLPLLLQLPGKRMLFMVTNIMLYLSGPLLYLLPSPLMPTAIRMAHFFEMGLLMLLYGVISGILLHTVMKKVVPPKRMEDDPPAQQKQAARPKARQAAKR